MKLKTATVLCCLVPMIAFSQFTGKWDQTISSDYDVLVDVGYDNSQNVYLLGKKSNSDDDIVLVKYNSSGKVWARTYDSGDDDEPKRLQVDGSGNSYIVGSADQGSKPECLALKYNTSGTLQWDDTYDYSSSSSGAGGIYNDAYLSGTTLYVVGDQYSGAVNNQDIVLARYTSGGSRTLRLYASGLYEYGKKIIVDGGSVHIAAIETINNDLIYHKFSTSFNSSSNPTSTATTSCSWTEILGFDVSGSSAAFVNDIGSSTGIITYSTSTFYSTTTSEIIDVSDMMIDGTKMIITGRKFVSEYRLVLAAHNLSGASQSFATVLKPTPSSSNHFFNPSGGISVFKNSTSEYVVAGNMVADDDPDDGNLTISPYVGFVTLNSSGVQQEFSLYEVGSGITHAFEDENNNDVILVGSKIYNLCNPPAPDLGTDITEDFDPSGNSIVLDAGSFSSYDWSTGETTQTITVSTEGIYSVEVTNSSGCPASDAINVTIDPIDQTISFTSIPDKVYGDSDFSLSASASSGLSVSFQSLDTDVATISGSTITIVSAGEVTIRATQSGNDNYNSASQVDRTFNVDYAKFYWVGDGGAADDFSSHWATTSGGSSMHTFEPDESCDIIFDSNSFSTTDEEITGGVIICHDFDASLATNNPIFQMAALNTHGSFYLSPSTTNRIGVLRFYSGESEIVDFGGANTANFQGDVVFGISLTPTGSWLITENFDYMGDEIYINFGQVTIDNGVTLTMDRSQLLHQYSSTLINNGSIVFESGSNYLKNSTATLSGNDLTFKRNPSFEGEGKYGVFGSPITNGSTSSLGSLVYEYDESQLFGSDDGLSRFIKINTPETMTPGKGYFSAFTNEVVFTGTPNSGTIDVPLDFNTSTGDEANYDGFNLVSNPYPAGLNFDTFIAANGPDGSNAITGTIYVWVDGGSDTERRTSADYMIINSMGTVSGNMVRAVNFNDYLGSFQGFFVQATGTGQTLSFTEDMRFSYGSWDANFFRSEKEEFSTIKLKVGNEVFYSEALIGLTPESTFRNNDPLDAMKLFGNYDLNVFSISEEKPMAIQAIPEYNNQELVIPIGLQISESGVYTFDVEASSKWDPKLNTYLYDTYKQEYYSLNEDPIQLLLNQGSDVERFQLVIRESIPLQSDHLLSYLLSFADMQIRFEGNLSPENTHLQIFDLSGKIIWSEKVKPDSNKIQSNFRFGQSQVYLIQISNPNSVITFKAAKQ